MLHVPEIDLVVAGDVIYNGVHQLLAEAGLDGISAWRDAVGIVESLHPRWIVAGHKNKRLDDDAARQLEETREYLNTAERLLAEHDTRENFFEAMIAQFPSRLNPTSVWAGAEALYR